MRRYAPSPMPGWGPISPPTHPQPRSGVRRQLIVPGLLFTAALFSGLLRTRLGMFAFALSVVLWFVLQNHPNRARTLAEWAAVAILVVVVSGAGVTTPKAKITADRRAPVERVHRKAKGDLDRVREGALNLWDQIAQGFPNPNPPERKGHR